MLNNSGEPFQTTRPVMKKDKYLTSFVLYSVSAILM